MTDDLPRIERKIAELTARLQHDMENVSRVWTHNRNRNTQHQCQEDAMKESQNRPPRRNSAKTRSKTISTVEELHSRANAAAETVERKGRAAFDQAAEWASDTYEKAYENGHHTFDQARETLRRNLHSAGSGFQHMATENPLTVAAAGLAAGFILGALVMRYGLAPASYDDEDEEDED